MSLSQYIYAVPDPARGITLDNLRAASDEIHRFCGHAPVGVHYRSRTVLIPRAAALIPLPMPLRMAPVAPVVRVQRKGEAGTSVLAVSKWSLSGGVLLSRMISIPDGWGPGKLMIEGLWGWGSLGSLVTASTEIATLSIVNAPIDAAVGTVGMITTQTDTSPEVVYVSSRSGQTATIERDLLGAGVTTPNGPGRWRPILPPSDLAAAANVIAKRWDHLQRQPGAGAYAPSADQGVPMSPALTFNLRATLGKYRRRR